MLDRIFKIRKSAGAADFAGKLAAQYGEGNSGMVLSENITVPAGTPVCGQLVIGKAGTGKTSCFVEPNILKADASLLITDNGGNLFRRHAHFLEENGYRVRHLDLARLKGDRYNPLAFVRGEKDIEDLAEAMIMNTAGTVTDPVGICLEKALFMALAAYLCFCTKEESRTFSRIEHLLATADIRLAGGRTALDSIFDNLGGRTETRYAEKQYRIYRTGAGDGARMTAASCAARLHAFGSGALAEMTDTDDMELSFMGKKKTAVFVSLPVAAGPAARFLASAAATQAFAAGGEGTDIPVKIFLDGTEGRVRTPLVIRSAGFSPGAAAGITVQSAGQLKNAYPEEWKDLIRGFGTLIVLGGGMDEGEAAWLSEAIMERVGDGRKAAFATPSRLRTLPFGSCCIAVKGTGACVDKNHRPPEERRAQCRTQ